MLSTFTDASGQNEIGVLNAPTPLPGGTFSPGTYTIFESDIQSGTTPGANTVLSLQGIWRPYTEVLANIGDAAMIIFPNSRNDPGGFIAVYILRDTAGNITSLWQGPARLFNDGISVDEIRLTRIRDIVAGPEIDPAVGVLSNFTMANGEIVTGTFTFAPALTPADFPFQLTGQFRVFRI